MHEQGREQVFRRKAREALLVARFSRRWQPDSSVNRSYYAVHMPMNGRYGADFPKRHGEIMRRSVLQRVGLTPDDAATLQGLYNARRIADYGAQHVSAHRAEACWLGAKAILRRLGIDES